MGDELEDFISDTFCNKLEQLYLDLAKKSFYPTKWNCSELFGWAGLDSAYDHAYEPPWKSGAFTWNGLNFEFDHLKRKGDKEATYYFREVGKRKWIAGGM